MPLQGDDSANPTIATLENLAAELGTLAAECPLLEDEERSSWRDRSIQWLAECRLAQLHESQRLATALEHIARHLSTLANR